MHIKYQLPLTYMYILFSFLSDASAPNLSIGVAPIKTSIRE